MIKIVTIYEDNFFPRGADRCMWKHLTSAYGAKFQLVERIEDAEIPGDHTVYVLNENGETRLHDMPRGSGEPNAVFILGRTAMAPLTVSHAKTIRIDTPGQNGPTFFRVHAASILLEHLYGCQH